MPNITILVNPPNEPIVVNKDGTVPAMITPRAIVATLDVRAAAFTKTEVELAATDIANIVSLAPITIVRQVLLSVFPDATFEREGTNA